MSKCVTVYSVIFFFFGQLVQITRHEVKFNKRNQLDCLQEIFISSY